MMRSILFKDEDYEFVMEGLRKQGVDVPEEWTLLMVYPERRRKEWLIEPLPDSVDLALLEPYLLEAR